MPGNKMQGVIYKTTNQINGKWYIGRNSTNDPKYLGSGVLLDKAIKKYGRDNFKKEILAEADTLQELINLEEKFILETDAVKDANSYNISPKGSGGIASQQFIQSRHDGRKKWWNTLSDDEKFDYQSSRSSGWWNKLNDKEKIKQINIRRNNTKNYHAGLTKQEKEIRIERHKDKISSTYRITCPDGRIVITNRLKDLCKSKELNISYNSLKISEKEKRSIKNGWLCEKLEKKNGN